MTDVMVSFGSNIDPVNNLAMALSRISRYFDIQTQALVLRTKAIAPEQQDDYLNTAVRFSTDLSLFDLQRELRAVEAELGRVRAGQKYAPRTIDLDVVVWEREVIDPDVAYRPFLFGEVIELFPDVNLHKWYPIISAEQRKWAGEFAKQIHTRLELLLPTYGIGRFQAVVLGAGHWFCGEAAPGSDIDFIVLTSGLDHLECGHLESALKKSDSCRQAPFGYPVSLRVIPIEYLDYSWLERLPVTQTLADPDGPIIVDRRTAISYSRFATEWVYLAGELNILKRLPQPNFSTCDEVEWNRQLTVQLIHEEFQNRNPGIRFHDVVKQFLYFRITKDSLTKYYGMSFEGLRMRHRDKPSDLVHSMLAHRYYAEYLNAAQHEAALTRMLKEVA
jgi:2-amino-4-hydroxy-6-hydroxymethyldihydropteridine diphosphokinase